MAGAADFDRCLGRPATLKAGAFALHVAAASADAVAPALPRVVGAGEPVWRLGLVIPKRFEASAVARNTIKRRWRGAFRIGRDAWAREFGSADVVVRMHAPLVTKAERAAHPVQPAKWRARAAFDPGEVFLALAERLRRGGQRREPRTRPALARRTGPD